MERGAAAAGPRVAVPAAVWPLPGDQRSGEQLGPRVGGHPEPAGDGQGVALLGGAAAGEPVDHLHAPAVGPAGQPVQHGRGGGLQAWLPGWGGQLDQRHQPPVGPGPLAVGVDAEAAVGLLAGQQRPGLGSLQELGGVGGRGRAVPVLEQLPAGQVADGRLLGGTQPR